MKTIKTFLLPLLAVLFIATSCEKDDEIIPPSSNNPLDEYVLIGEVEATTLNYNVKVYATENLFVGYNNIMIQVKDNQTGETINNPKVMFMPEMTMNSGMKHSCPLEQPSFNTTLMVAEGTITFVMPGGQMGSWMLALDLENNNGEKEMVEIPVDVVQKTDPQLFSFVSAADPTQSIFVALVNPKKPDVGINDFEVVVYNRETMMSWPAVDDLKIEIDPEMPTMGHGSPNNVNPISMGNGHYLGKVNFTMTGYWKVNMVFKTSTDDMMKDDAFFDINF